ncbi:MAG: cobalt transporter [Myxococcales bacterium]|nr:cobalt transporter [Myxococcales bacterium]
MAGSSRTAVVSAIAGNTAVMIAKFVAFGMTGSGAMLSEGIHSAADVLNQLLLFIGIVRSDRAPTPDYPVGYGRERYIWALISAVGIFFLGCGVTTYHGITGLMHPHELGDLTAAVVVLLLSLLIEGFVFFIALRAMKKEAGDKPFFAYVKTEADPSAMAVLLEDAAACLGIVIALTCIGLAQVTGQTYWDSIGSIFIGILLGAVAIYLITRNHQLLIGQAVPDDVQQQLKTLIESNTSVEELVEFKARMIDLNTYDIMANVEFDGEAIADRLEPGLKEAWDGIDTYDDFRDFARGYADDVVEALGDEIDAIEKNIKETIPQAKFMDIEAN